MIQEHPVLKVLQNYFEASAVLTPLLAGFQFLGLLRGAVDSGLLTAARTPSTTQQFAANMNTDIERVGDYCHALDAHGVFIKENDTYRLADMWATLAAPEAVFSFEVILDHAQVLSNLIAASLKNTETYWTLTSAERLTLAKGVTTNPFSPHSPIVLDLFFQSIPGIYERLAQGAQFLDIGCGVGSGLLGTLVAFPDSTAVAIEIAGDILEETRRRAIALNVHDRVVFWQGDAREFPDQSKFDFVHWAHTFFPVESRAGTLKMAFDAVKPRGYFIAPLENEPLATDEDLHTETGRANSLQRLIYGSWGIRPVSHQDFQQELEVAGFDEIQVLNSMLGNFILARHP